MYWISLKGEGHNPLFIKRSQHRGHARNSTADFQNNIAFIYRNGLEKYVFRRFSCLFECFFVISSGYVEFSFNFIC